MSDTITITGSNFESEVLQSAVPVLIDFWAPWCGPCKMIGPFIDELAKEYEGRLKVGKVNIDDEGTLAERHNVVSIPTLMVYKDGQIANLSVGVSPKPKIEGLFKDLV
jgi:thioredoxin 1